jgi:putative peptidoglycan lipid II flippase
MSRNMRSGFRIARLAAIAGLAKGPGFLIPLLLAAFFGAGHLTDAYFLAYGGVLLVGGTVGQPLEAAIVPFAAHALTLGHRAADRFTLFLFRRGLLVGLVAALVGGALLVVGVSVLQPKQVAVVQVFEIYLLLAPAAVAWCVAGLYTGSLVSAWRLEVGAVGYGFRGVGALIGALTGGFVHQLWPVALGLSIGEWGRVWWLRMHWRQVLSSVSEGIGGTPERGFTSAAAHQMVAQGVLSGAQFLERFLVGTVAVAAISRVEYANRLITVAAVLFDGAIGPWLLARWSNLQVRNGLESDWRKVYRLISIAGLVALVVAGILVVAAPLIVVALFHHGAFTSNDAVIVTQIFRLYAIGYLFNMSSLCVDRLLLARAQNRLFAGLAGIRGGVRLGVILGLLGTAGVFALPLGYIASEAVYLVVVLLASRRGTNLQLQVQES